MDKLRRRANKEGLPCYLFNGNTAITDELPKAKKKKLKKARAFRSKKSILTSYLLDEGRPIYPKKWYLLFFDRFDNPAVLNQSWHKKRIMIEWWQHKLGVKHLPKDYFIIRGECIEPEYRICQHVRYRGKDLRIRSKVLFPPEVRQNKNRKGFKASLYKYMNSNGKSRDNEKTFFEALFRTLPEKFKPQFNRSAIISMKYRENREKLNARINEQNHNHKSV